MKVKAIIFDCFEVKVKLTAEVTFQVDKIGHNLILGYPIRKEPLNFLTIHSDDQMDLSRKFYIRPKKLFEVCLNCLFLSKFNRTLRIQP